MWREDAEPASRFRRRRSEKIANLTDRLLRCRLNGRIFRAFCLRFMPILNWLPQYKWRESFFSDLSAGLTMAVFSVPTGIAHAGICGVEPVYGLYTAIFPTFFYLFFGNSKHNALGGFAILSLMIRSAIEKVDRLMQATVLPLAISTAFLNSSLESASEPALLTTSPTSLITNETILLLSNESIFGGGAERIFFQGEVDSGIKSDINGSLLLIDTAGTALRNSVISNATEIHFGDQNSGGTIDVNGKKLRPIHIATTIMFLAGIFQILMGIFRLDFLSCYLSEQVMSGFVVGGCVHVFFSQLGDILGIQLPSRSGRGYLYMRFMDIIEHLNETHVPTAIISSCSIGFLLFSQQILEPWLSSVFQFPIPYELILVIVGITATNFAQLSKRHSITVVGNIPTNFPAPELPNFDLISWIFFDAVSITITAVAIHLTVVKIVENRYHYKINSCQELYSLGFAGLFASMFPVFPVTSIFARTLIGDADKNSTQVHYNIRVLIYFQMTMCFSMLALLAVILFVGPALEYLPKCILASMVVVSLSASLTKFRELRALWPLFKFDFLIFVVSLLLTVCYDMAEGLTFTVIFAIFTIVVRDQWPKWHFLSHDDSINAYIETPKEQLHVIENDACVLRYDAPLIFTSVHKFTKVVYQGVKRWEKRDSNALKADETGYRWRVIEGGISLGGKNKEENNRTVTTSQTILIIDCSGFPYVDYLGLCTLKRIYMDFSNDGIIVKFAAPKAVLMRMFRESDFMNIVPNSHIFPTVSQAVSQTCQEDCCSFIQKCFKNLST